MTALWIVLGVLLGLILLVSLLFFVGKAGIRIRYDETLRVTLYVFAIPIQLVGKDRKSDEKKNLSRCRNPERVLKKELKRQKKAAKKAYKKALEKKKRAAEHALQKKLEKANTPALGIKANLEIIHELLKTLRDGTTGRINIRVRQLKIRIATEDAAKTAILYGVVLQSASYLLEWIDSSFNQVRRNTKEMEIVPDYLTTSTTAKIDIHCSMRIFRLAFLVFDLFNTHKEEKSKAIRRARKKAQIAPK